MMRFDRFTQKAQEAAMHALEILRRYKHTQVDTEHLLLALLQQSDGAIPQIMQKLEVDQGIMAQKLEAALESAVAATGGRSPGAFAPDFGGTGDRGARVPGGQSAGAGGRAARSGDRAGARVGGRGAPAMGAGQGRRRMTVARHP